MVEEREGSQARRILITGLSSSWGGRAAQLLERDPGVETVIGIDIHDPRHELDRTEFIRVATEPTLLKRIISATRIDTVLDTRLIDDPLLASLEQAHEVNVLGTRNVLQACSGDGSPVRKVVFKSSAQIYGSAAGDPAFFSEDMVLDKSPATALERHIAAAERSVREFAAENPQKTVSVARTAAAIDSDLRSSFAALLALPVLPAILGFDPRLQFVHEDDVVESLVHLVTRRLPGTFNVAGDGVLALSEIASLLGKPLLPVLPPWGSGLAAAALRRLGVPVPVELIRSLRYGCGLDNRRLKASGYQYRYTTREAILKFRARQRLRPLLRSGGGAYRYEPEVEEFLRRSRSVQPPAAPPAGSDGVSALQSLTAAELIEVIATLEPEALVHLRDYEASHSARAEVLEALDRRLAGRPGTRR